MTEKDKLLELRKLLSLNNIDSYFITSEDPHQSELVTPSEKKRAYISNFRGSCGTALVTQNEALLWTDGRYWNEASKSLSSEWTLMRSGQPGVLNLSQWLIQNFRGKKVGIDAFRVSTQFFQKLQKEVEGYDISIVIINENLIDIVWGTEIPPFTVTPIYSHQLRFAGQTSESKINIIQSKLKASNTKLTVVSMLDEIAWLLNVRGLDIPLSPVIISYVIIPSEGPVHWFLPQYDTRTIDPEVFENLRINSDNPLVTLHPYEDVESFLISSINNLKESNEQDVSIHIDPTCLNWRLYSIVESYCISSKIRISTVPSYIILLKAIKNEAELNGMRECHIRDGVALTAFFAWLDRKMKQIKLDNSFENLPTEYESTEVLVTFRQKMDKFLNISFTTISSYGPNGSIIHYHPTKENSSKLGFDSLYLCDSGGQYLDGTTDVTRTLHFGEPTQRMKDCFTAVLQGHIALAQLIFPERTYGWKIDSVARLPIWRLGLEYNHGTGHGVGAHLLVHEGPQGISSYIRGNDQGFVPGMITSNEPGYYDIDKFGIRIENLCITILANTPNNHLSNNYCTFETITFCPIQASLINYHQLFPHEIEWINNYHSQVREKLLPLMTIHFPEAVEYLIEQTKELTP